MGMTDKQFQAMLIDELEDWQELLAVVKAAGNEEAVELAERKIEKINEKMKA